MNLDYETIYTVYNKLPMFARHRMYSNFSQSVALSWAVARFEQSFQDALKKRYFEMFPRRRKWDADYACRSMGEDVVDEIRAEYQKRALAMIQARIKQAQKMDDLMDVLAKDVKITPQERGYLLASCPFSAYASQGYGAMKYARGSLIPQHDLLLAKGYNPVIVENLEGRSYELWANLLPWQFDAIWRKDAPTIMEWAVLCWKAGCNPKVYNPFLSDEVFEQSIAVVYERT